MLAENIFTDNFGNINNNNVEIIIDIIDIVNFNPLNHR